MIDQLRELGFTDIFVCPIHVGIEYKIHDRLRLIYRLDHEYRMFCPGKINVVCENDGGIHDTGLELKTIEEVKEYLSKL